VQQGGGLGVAMFPLRRQQALVDRRPDDRVREREAGGVAEQLAGQHRGARRARVAPLDAGKRGGCRDAGAVAEDRNRPGQGGRDRRQPREARQDGVGESLRAERSDPHRVRGQRLDPGLFELAKELAQQKRIPGRRVTAGPRELPIDATVTAVGEHAQDPIRAEATWFEHSGDGVAEQRRQHVMRASVGRAGGRQQEHRQFVEPARKKAEEGK
jgi:hypothetical protein